MELSPIAASETKGQIILHIFLDDYIWGVSVNKYCRHIDYEL